MELKRHKSVSDQVSILASRGLIISNRNAAEEFLTNVNYYRFSGYLHGFKVPGSDNYIDGLSFDKVRHIYDFDRKLTRILMFALEDIEETLKTRISYSITSCNPDDPLIYLRPFIYRNDMYDEFQRFRKVFDEAVFKNQNSPFIKHHKQVYNGALPMWVAVEIMTMGNLHALYDMLLPSYQKRIAKTYNTGPDQLSSWITHLTYTRNHLAHYMRIYDYDFGRTPKRCSKHHFYTQRSNRIFDQLYIMSFLHSNADEWNAYILPQIRFLLIDYNEDVDPARLGFPSNWEQILLKTSQAPIGNEMIKW